MPSKRQRKKGDKHGKKTLTKMKGAAICSIITPGPEYLLKTLVGYDGHCISRFRNPAYTFGGRRISTEIVKSPGPKYMIQERRPVGFTFGSVAKHRDVVLGPGPKYRLPDLPRGPLFSMKWRTKLRKSGETPGPYYVKPFADASAFTMGLRTVGVKPMASPGPYWPYNLNVIKPSAPTYTMTCRRAIRFISNSPGPIYAVMPPKPTPAFSFGMKHSECAPPYITECDEQC